MSKQVIVYSTEGCIECGFVKQMLTEEGIPFEVRDVMKSEEYQKEVEKFGFMGVPVTVVGDKAVKGLTPELRELIATVK
ncbi:ribonucleoside-diphosphate reductase class Ib glutaredoxin subunit [Bacillus oleivorans]|uniref:Ribonucleoside-diphosphate reductase class Ib glutaredoxin subunit n=1 Tax=Bacillus oleivorans TaxID=1448271 RepID=A0A285D6Y6_9BACI|nr:glutaredoxin family protein [Bacillus oleivorans]SNX75579.1 ribonucleoside-diphosphate reductase class Ib glutaredoxin subunit [Bacillus oleivorans]